MRILFINQFYKPDIAATGQLLADLAEALAERGHEVEVLCSRHAYSGGNVTFPAKEVLNGVSVHRIRATGFGHNSILGSIIDYISFYVLAGWRVLRLPKVDVCVSLTTPPFVALLGLMLRILKGTRVAVWTMDLYPEVPLAFGFLKNKGVLYRLLARLNRRIYRTSSSIFSLGEVMTRRLVEAGAPPEKIVTVHNWVPGEVVRKAHLRKHQEVMKPSPNGTITLLYSGNLGLGHEFDMIVSALSQVNSGASVKAIFVGDGKAKHALGGLAKELGYDHIEFRRPVPLGELPGLLLSGDVHFVAQKQGTQGLLVPSKIYAVLAAGRPTLFVGPSDSEVAMIVNESRSGFVVEPGDAEALVDALRTLALDSDLRHTMGKRARRYYEEHFGRDKSVSRIIKVIEETVESESASKESHA